MDAGATFVNGIPVINNVDWVANEYAVNQDNYEAITQSLYDSAAYPSAGVTQLTFFQLPVGSGLGVISNAAKTPEDTNMQAPGTMPNQQAYIVTSIEVEIQTAVPNFSSSANLPAAFGGQQTAQIINDQWKIRVTGYLNFNVGQKSYMLEGPLMKFPASNDFEIDAAVADFTTPAGSMQSRIANGKAVGPAYILAPNNVLLIPMQNFNVTLSWANTENTPSGQGARIFVRFMGQLLRASQ